MEVGSRVAYVIAGNAKLGVVAADTGEMTNIIMDNGVKLSAMPDRLRLVNYWKDSSRERSVESLRFYPSDSQMVDIFKNRSGVNFGLCTLRAMWLWGNHHIFGRQLTMPKLRINSSKRAYGEYHLARGARLGSITISSANHSLYQIFSTMLHEIVHQYNFEVDWLQQHNFDPQYEGSHGQVFLEWIPKIYQATGVRIAITESGTNDVTLFDDEELPQGEALTQPFIFILFQMQTRWFGFVVRDELMLSGIIGNISSILMRNRAAHTRVYAGVSRLRRVWAEFPKLTRNTLTNQNLKRVPSLAVVKLAAATAQKIGNYSLPDSAILQ